jgi:alkylhydroperoxidase family enzyme
MSRKQFGKVPTPVKIVYACTPIACGMLVSKIAQPDKNLELPQETAYLIREQVAHSNVCTLCTDIGRYFVIKAQMNEAKFDALGEYPTSPLLGEAERAALEYVTELTREQAGRSRNLRARTPARLRARHLRHSVARPASTLTT